MQDGSLTWRATQASVPLGASSRCRTQIAALPSCMVARFTFLAMSRPDVLRSRASRQFRKVDSDRVPAPGDVGANGTTCVFPASWHRSAASGASDAQLGRHPCRKCLFGAKARMQSPSLSGREVAVPALESRQFDAFADVEIQGTSSNGLDDPEPNSRVMHSGSALSR